jgi:hypothetical protein
MVGLLYRYSLVLDTSNNRGVEANMLLCFFDPTIMKEVTYFIDRPHSKQWLHVS